MMLHFSQFVSFFLQICAGVINKQKRVATKLALLFVVFTNENKNFLDSLLLTWEHFYKLDTTCVRNRQKNMSQDIKFFPLQIWSSKKTKIQRVSRI
jgi:hypothetical protein